MSPTARLPEGRTTIETAIKVKVNVKIAYQIVVGGQPSIVHPGLTISVWRNMHAEWRVLHIGRIGEHLD
jgi:hypothetical protein